MRSLIRPALFMVARIGLVLSVGFWIVGQWFFTAAEFFILDLGFDGSGWCAIASEPLTFGEVDFRLHRRDVDSASSERRFWLERTIWHDSSSLGSLTSTHVIAIRHWLVVTFFALFYGVLKWVYRKREVANE